MIYNGQIMYGMIFNQIIQLQVGINLPKALDTAVIAWYNNIIIRKERIKYD